MQVFLGALVALMYAGMVFNPAPAAAEPSFPPRFIVQTHGGQSFFCDLTVTQDASCTSHDRMVMTLGRITIRRHAGDPTRVAIFGYDTKKTGVTWSQLRKGVVLGPFTVGGHTLGPVTVVALD